MSKGLAERQARMLRSERDVITDSETGPNTDSKSFMPVAKGLLGCKRLRVASEPRDDKSI